MATCYQRESVIARKHLECPPLQLIDSLSFRNKIVIFMYISSLPTCREVSRRRAAARTSQTARSVRTRGWLSGRGWAVLPDRPASSQARSTPASHMPTSRRVDRRRMAESCSYSRLLICNIRMLLKGTVLRDLHPQFKVEKTNPLYVYCICAPDKLRYSYTVERSQNRLLGTIDS